MTALELREAFLVGYDVKTNFAAPGYENSEISLLLNQAQDKVTEGFIRANNLDYIRELYRNEEFKLIACTTEPLGDAAFQSDGLTASECLHYVTGKLLATRTSIVPISNKKILCQLVTRTDADKFIQQPSNQPLLLYPKILLHHIPETGTVGKVMPIVLVDMYTTPVLYPNTGLWMTYIKVPERIDIDSGITCELNNRLHQIVVNVAVELAMQASDSSRLQQQQQRPQQQRNQNDEE